MAFFESIIWGASGSYQVLGVPISFIDKKTAQPTPGESTPGEEESILKRIFIKSIQFLGKEFLQSRTVLILSQKFAHILEHEMGHALALTIFTSRSSKVKIYVQEASGAVKNVKGEELPPRIATVVDAAGPIFAVFCCGCKVVAASALSSMSKRVALFLAAGPLLWMTSECVFAYISVIIKNEQDFHKIAKRSKLHFFVTTTLLVSEYALALFLAWRLLK